MSQTNTPTPGRIAAAFALAVVADGIQLPLNALTLTGVLAFPSELLDLVIDGGMCVAESYLLGGFHWILAPAAVAEAIPVLDAFPTWTGAVAALVWIRRREGTQGEATGVGTPAPQPLEPVHRDAEVISARPVVALQQTERAS